MLTVQAYTWGKVLRLQRKKRSNPPSYSQEWGFFKKKFSTDFVGWKYVIRLFTIGLRHEEVILVIVSVWLGLCVVTAITGGAAAAPSDSALPVIEQMLDSDEPGVQAEGLELLDGSQDLDSINLKYKALFHRDAAMRRRAVEGLLACSGDELVPLLLDTLGHGTLFEIQVIEDVARLLQPRVETPVLSVLTDADASGDRRILAAYLLGCLHAPHAIEPLAQIVWQEDHALAMASVQALGRMRMVQTFPYLQSMLGHASEDIRWEAVHGIGNLRSDEALHALVTVATSGTESNEMIRRQALIYLGASDKAEAIPLLIECMQYSQGLRDVGGEALRQLTGRHYGGSVIEWQRWYQEESRTAKSLDELLYSHKLKEAAREAEAQAEELPVGVTVQSNLP